MYAWLFIHGHITEMISSEFHDAISWHVVFFLLSAWWLMFTLAFVQLSEVCLSFSRNPEESFPAAVKTTLIFSFEEKYWRNRGLNILITSRWLKYSLRAIAFMKDWCAVTFLSDWMIKISWTFDLPYKNSSPWHCAEAIAVGLLGCLLHCCLLRNHRKHLRNCITMPWQSPQNQGDEFCMGKQLHFTLTLPFKESWNNASWFSQKY